MENHRSLLFGRCLKTKTCDKFRPPINYMKTFKPLEDHSEWIDNIDEEKETLDGQVAYSSDSVMLNYIIVKQILRNLKWQDLKLASLVSKLWNEAAKNLSKFDLTPQHFSVRHDKKKQCIIYTIDEEPNSEPMLILAFLDDGAMLKKIPSTFYPGYESGPKLRYKMLDYAHIKLSYPSNALIGISCEEVIYPTVKSGLSEAMYEEFIGGLYFPQIKGVRIHKICQRITAEASNKNIISDELNKIMETEHIKCILIFLGRVFDDSHDYIIKKFIADVEARQGDEYPFAVGGCIINGTVMNNYNENKEFRAFTTIVIGTDKSIPDSLLNFDVFSKITARNKDSKHEITANIAQMSELIPKREYSAAVKLSCVGRTNSHNFEEAVFMKHFPATKTVGCFGMGEIGLDNMPRKNSPADTETGENTESKKLRVDNAQNHKLFYEYSSVVVFFSWGHLK